MFALFSRILKLAGQYKGRIQGAFVCAFAESILSKMPIFLAFVVLSGFAAGTLTGQTCLYVGLGLAAAVLVQMLRMVSGRLSWRPVPFPLITSCPNLVVTLIFPLKGERASPARML